MTDEANANVEAVEHPPVIMTVNQNPAVRDPMDLDIAIRCALINMLHATGWDAYEAEAVNSLRNAYPRFFRSDS